MTDWAAEQKKKQDANKAKMVALLKKRKSIKKVVVEYDGSGDSGEVNSVTFYDKKDVEHDDVPEGLEEAVSDFIYDALPGGWEINSGSFGTATIDCTTMKVHFDHNDRIETSEEAPFDLDL